MLLKFQYLTELCLLKTVLVPEESGRGKTCREKNPHVSIVYFIKSDYFC